MAVLRSFFGLCAAVFESVAVVAGLDDVAVVGESVEQSGRHFCAPKYVCSFSEAEIGGDDEACVLVELADEVEQQRAAGLAEWQIPEFVENHDVRDNSNSGYSDVTFFVQYFPAGVGGTPGP